MKSLYQQVDKHQPVESSQADLMNELEPFGFLDEESDDMYSLQDEKMAQLVDDLVNEDDIEKEQIDISRKGKAKVDVSKPIAVPNPWTPSGDEEEQEEIVYTPPGKSPASDKSISDKSGSSKIMFGSIASKLARQSSDKQEEVMGVSEQLGSLSIGVKNDQVSVTPTLSGPGTSSLSTSNPVTSSPITSGLSSSSLGTSSLSASNPGTSGTIGISDSIDHKTSINPSTRVGPDIGAGASRNAMTSMYDETTLNCIEVILDESFKSSYNKIRTRLRKICNVEFKDSDLLYYFKTNILMSQVVKSCRVELVKQLYEIISLRNFFDNEYLRHRSFNLLETRMEAQLDRCRMYLDYEVLNYLTSYNYNEYFDWAATISDQFRSCSNFDELPDFFYRSYTTNVKLVAFKIVGNQNNGEEIEEGEIVESDLDPIVEDDGQPVRIVTNVCKDPALSVKLLMDINSNVNLRSKFDWSRSLLPQMKICETIMTQRWLALRSQIYAMFYRQKYLHKFESFRSLLRQVFKNSKSVLMTTLMRMVCSSVKHWNAIKGNNSKRPSLFIKTSASSSRNDTHEFNFELIDDNKRINYWRKPLLDASNVILSDPELMKDTKLVCVLTELDAYSHQSEIAMRLESLCKYSPSEGELYSAMKFRNSFMNIDKKCNSMRTIQIIESLLLVEKIKYDKLKRYFDIIIDSSQILRSCIQNYELRVGDILSKVEARIPGAESVYKLIESMINEYDMFELSHLFYASFNEQFDNITPDERPFYVKANPQQHIDVQVAVGIPKNVRFVANACTSPGMNLMKLTDNKFNVNLNMYFMANFGGYQSRAVTLFTFCKQLSNLYYPITEIDNIFAITFSFRETKKLYWSRHFFSSRILTDYFVLIHFCANFKNSIVDFVLPYGELAMPSSSYPSLYSMQQQLLHQSSQATDDEYDE